MNPQPYEWLAPQKALATRMYEAGAPLFEIAAAVGRSEDAIRRAVGRWKLNRPEGHVVVHKRSVWVRVRAALEASTGLTIDQICETCGIEKSCVIGTIKLHRAELYIARRIPTARRPRAVWRLGNLPDAPVESARRQKVRRRDINPFAGLIQQI